MRATHVALLRGINVGRAKRVAMADLRNLFAQLGYLDIATLLNSGNVVFTSTEPVPEITERVEAAILKRCGFSSKTIIVPAERFQLIAAENPLASVAHDPTRLLIAFLKEPTQIPISCEPPEQVAAGHGVLYLWCPDGILASRSIAQVGTVYKDGVTTRNWATVQKIAARLRELG